MDIEKTMIFVKGEDKTNAIAAISFDISAQKHL